MSDKNKENSVVFSNKELKEVANTPPPKPVAPRKRASFIDDAGSILSDIKSAIGDEVAEELQRFEDERRSAAAAVLQREEALQEARRTEIQARRAAEEARRQAAAEEREMLLNRLQEGPKPAINEEASTQKPFEPSDSKVQFSEPVTPKKSKMPLIASIAAIVLIGAGYVATSANSENAQPAPSPASTVATPLNTTAVPGPVTPAKSELATPKGSVTASSIGAAPLGDAGVRSMGDGGATSTDAAKPPAKKPAKTSKEKRKRSKNKKRKKKKKKKKKKYEINLDDID